MKTIYIYHKISPKGLNYLGITCKNPFKYRGSGKYWLRHLKIHKISYLDMNLLKEWNSAKEAALYYNIHTQNISAVCNNREKTAKGFIWKYQSN